MASVCYNLNYECEVCFKFFDLSHLQNGHFFQAHSSNKTIVLSLACNKCHSKATNVKNMCKRYITARKFNCTLLWNSCSVRPYFSIVRLTHLLCIGLDLVGFFHSKSGTILYQITILLYFTVKSGSKKT